MKILGFAVPLHTGVEVIAQLKEDGVHEINGRPVEECIYECGRFVDIPTAVWNKMERGNGQAVVQ